MTLVSVDLDNLIVFYIYMSPIISVPRPLYVFDLMIYSFPLLEYNLGLKHEIDSWIDS